MPNLKQNLKQILNGATKVAVLGVGSDLRSDDAAGLIVAEELEKKPSKSYGEVKLKVFIGGTAPENLTGEIRRFSPSHLIIIDSADLGEKPGTARLIDNEHIGGMSFSTHRIPTNIMIDYFSKSIGCEVLVIGIQPKAISFGENVSKEVRRSAEGLSTVISDALKYIK